MLAGFPPIAAVWLIGWPSEVAVALAGLVPLTAGIARSQACWRLSLTPMTRPSGSARSSTNGRLPGLRCTYCATPTARPQW